MGYGIAAVTPPRVPELRSLREFLGSTQPILLDWMVGLVFPCQHPMLHADGVTEVPRYRIRPNYPGKLQNPDTWQEGQNGGLLGITDVLLRAHVMATYLSDDWGRDWGSLRRFESARSYLRHARQTRSVSGLKLRTRTGVDRSFIYNPGHCCSCATGRSERVRLDHRDCRIKGDLEGSGCPLYLGYQ